MEVGAIRSGVSKLCEALKLEGKQVDGADHDVEIMPSAMSDGRLALDGVMNGYLLRVDGSAKQINHEQDDLGEMTLNLAVIRRATLADNFVSETEIQEPHQDFKGAALMLQGFSKMCGGV